MRRPLSAALCALGSVCMAHTSQEPCRTPGEAKAIAESETLGEAVTVRRIIQSDGTPGWEVLVHMTGRAKGWRCVVDQDLAKVRWKEAIPNPPSRIPAGSKG